jgi:hypothetical protein
MSDWRGDLVGKFVWNPVIGFAGVVTKVWGPGEYEGPDGRKVAAPVLEFEDGTSSVASDDRQSNFQPMSRNAALLHELSTRVVADGARLLATHAHAYGLDAKVSALIVSLVLARQARVLKALADRKEPDDEPPAADPPKLPSAAGPADPP